MEEIGLTAYLDVLGQPAVVLTSPVAATIELCEPKALVTCYVNERFRELVAMTAEGLGAIATSSLVGIGFVSILQDHSAPPSTSLFLEWIDETKHSVEGNSRFFKSVFRQSDSHEGASSVQGRPTDFVHIEWNGAVVQEKYIVLIGRYTDTDKRSSQLPNTKIKHLVLDPSPIEEIRSSTTSSETDISPSSSPLANGSPNGSPKNPRGRLNSMAKPLARLGSFEEHSSRSTPSGYTWQNQEKVSSSNFYSTS
jgi:hypothetical protein